MFGLDAYLDRVGLSGTPDLAALHRAHVGAIPFENLDPHRGVPVALDPEALERKLVTGGRGGYCFEHNLLLAAALEALGARAEPMLARVRWRAPAGMVRPLTHLVLRVDDAWLCDVGFGAGTLLEPIPFGPGGPYDVGGWSVRVVEEDDVLVLQVLDDGAWSDVYAFAPHPVPRIDIELSNWFTATHPASLFVTGLLVATVREDGAYVSLSDWAGELALVERTPEGPPAVVPLARSDIPAVLAERFGLPGFGVDDGGRVTLA